MSLPSVFIRVWCLHVHSIHRLMQENNSNLKPYLIIAIIDIIINTIITIIITIIVIVIIIIFVIVIIIVIISKAVN